MSGGDERAAVSVVIPCFQAAATIGRALASVAGQSLRPYEVIIVDDASEAETREVLRGLEIEYGRDWLKVHFLSDNRGPAAARNHGWERATQPYVAFLDADDSWHRDKTALQFSFMRRYPEIDLTACNCGGPENLVRRLPKIFQVQRYSLRQLLFRNRLRTQAVMLKRAIILRFPEQMRFSEDYYLWLNLLAAGSSAAIINLPLAAIYKPAFGAAGLSAELWRMERGELEALQAARRRGSVPLPLWSGAVVWSLLKFLRRLWLTRLHLFTFKLKCGLVRL